ncbi:MAG: hypothetical protein EAZ35_06580 [Sphingobacteriia bacterium]|nr:MAG: hypothetical protein EAZ35_06580 [Sphingobacteriia bacterium]
MGKNGVEAIGFTPTFVTKLIIMKLTKNILISLGLMVFATALYRIFPDRPLGFAPQIAVALFAGSIFVKDKKIAFLLPLLSMFISDLLYELLHINGLSTIGGFYKGQWVNYLLFISLTGIGFLVNNRKIVSIFAAAIAAPTAYFILSNGLVWLKGGGFNRPKNMGGLIACYADGLPFYPNSIYSTLFFAAVLFGSYALFSNKIASKNLA